MLIPSIDLQNGSVVQLVQGEKLAIKADDAEPWIAKFSRFPRVQLIDLDAAMGKGDNAAIVAGICGRLPCRVGGGIRSVARARAVLDAGAHAVIASSALFRDGAVDTAFAAELAAAVGRERVIAAVDSRGGRVAIHGWKTVLPDHRRGRGEGAGALLRRVPLHPRGQGGADAGHRHGRHPGGAPGDHPARHRRRRHHHLGTISTRWTPPAWTRWWAWRSTPASCRSTADAGRRSGRSVSELTRYRVTLDDVTVTDFYVIDAEPLRLRRDRPRRGLRRSRGRARPSGDRPGRRPEGLPDLAAPLRQVVARPAGARRAGPAERAHGRGDGQQLQLVPVVPRGLRRRAGGAGHEVGADQELVRRAPSVDAARAALRAEGHGPRPVLGGLSAGAVRARRDAAGQRGLRAAGTAGRRAQADVVVALDEFQAVERLQRRQRRARAARRRPAAAARRLRVRRIRAQPDGADDRPAPARSTRRGR